MFYFFFEVKPEPRSPNASKLGGAFVNCWIDRPTKDEAQLIAKSIITDDGWIVGEPDEAFQVDRSSYVDNPEGRELYEQALIDKEVCRIYTYPIVDEAE